MEKSRWSYSKEQRYCTKTRPGTFITNTSTNADHQHARNKDIAPKQDQALLLQTLLQMPINNMQRTKILQPYRLGTLKK